MFLESMVRDEEGRDDGGLVGKYERLE